MIIDLNDTDSRLFFHLYFGPVHSRRACRIVLASKNGTSDRDRHMVDVIVVLCESITPFADKLINEKIQGLALSCRQKRPCPRPLWLDQHQSQLFREETEVFFKSFIDQSRERFLQKKLRMTRKLIHYALLLHLAPSIRGRYQYMTSVVCSIQLDCFSILIRFQCHISVLSVERDTGEYDHVSEEFVEWSSARHESRPSGFFLVILRHWRFPWRRISRDMVECWETVKWRVAICVRGCCQYNGTCFIIVKWKGS